MRERESFDVEEISLLIDKMIGENELLSNVKKDGKNPKKAIMEKLEKFRITGSEYMMSYQEMTDQMNQVVDFFLNETIKSLLKNKGIQVFLDKKGEIGFSPKN